MTLHRLEWRSHDLDSYFVLPDRAGVAYFGTPEGDRILDREIRRLGMIVRWNNWRDPKMFRLALAGYCGA